MGKGREARARSFPDLAAQDRKFLLATVMKPSSSTSAEMEIKAAWAARVGVEAVEDTVAPVSEMEAALLGVTMVAMAGEAEVVALGSVVVGGAWRRADLGVVGCGSVEQVEAVRSQNQQG